MISLLLPVFYLHAETKFPVSVKDDTGHIVRLDKPAMRIISLAPHITESLFAAGAGEKVIGVISNSDYPEAAKKITRVGGYPSIDMEKIVSLKPDLIVAWHSGNKQKQVERLRTLGFPVFHSEPHHPEDIASTIQRFGILAGTSHIADKKSLDFLQQLEKLKKQYSHKSKIKVFYQVWNKPLMTVSGQHLISEIITLCGGENIFNELKTLTPTISVESVINRKADVIVAGGMPTVQPEWLKQWQLWQQLPAVEKQQIYFIDPSLLQRVGPRILQGAEQLCVLLDKVRSQELK